MRDSGLCLGKARLFVLMEIIYAFLSACKSHVRVRHALDLNSDMETHYVSSKSSQSARLHDITQSITVIYLYIFPVVCKGSVWEQSTEEEEEEEEAKHLLLCLIKTARGAAPLKDQSGYVCMFILTRRDVFFFCMRDVMVVDAALVTRQLC